MFVYLCNIKICALELSKFLKKHFLPAASCRSIFPAKSCRDASRSDSQLARGQVNMMDGAKLHSPKLQVLKLWLCDLRSGVVTENQNHSADQCQFQALWFCISHQSAVHIFLRLNGFTWIQKAIVDQTSSRRSNSDHDIFLLQVWLWEVLWSLFSVQPLVINSSCIKSIFCVISQSN